jgi:hypothetical protein
MLKFVNLLFAALVLTLANCFTLLERFCHGFNFFAHIFISILVAYIWFIFLYVCFIRKIGIDILFFCVFCIGSVLISYVTVYVLTPKDRPAHYWSGLTETAFFYHQIELLILFMLLTFTKIVHKCSNSVDNA